MQAHPGSGGEQCAGYPPCYNRGVARKTTMSETMATTARRWTLADLEALPDDGNRYEIIDGELHVTTAPHIWHQVVVGRAYKALEDWSESTGAGLTIPGPGVIISPTDAVIP